MTDVRKTYLPKWPALVVKGEPVTRVQAAEILVRTGYWIPHTNKREWRTRIEELVGYKEPRYDPDLTPEQRSAEYDEYARKDAEFRKQHGILYLHYLENARIASSWVGGPHGWCNWDGNIWCNNYNIGKWPSVEAVEQDWQNIAAAFPYLDLTAQLLNVEAGETPEDRPVTALVEFRVKDGKVETYAPEKLLLEPVSDWAPWVGTNAEQGCADDTLEEALQIARRAVAAKP